MLGIFYDFSQTVIFLFYHSSSPLFFYLFIFFFTGSSSHRNTSQHTNIFFPPLLFLSHFLFFSLNITDYSSPHPKFFSLFFVSKVLVLSSRSFLLHRNICLWNSGKHSLGNTVLETLRGTWKENSWRLVKSFSINFGLTGWNQISWVLLDLGFKALLICCLISCRKLGIFFFF